ncbi:unnamed protein product [Discula destructiva]
MANYQPAFAVQTPVDDGIEDFVAKFYTTSDTPGKNAEWVAFFHDDATLVMEKKTATGAEDILKVREGMWEKVQAREHTVFQVFPATFEKTEAGSVELMLYGHVVYKLKGADSFEPPVDWAGYARLVRAEDGAWKFAYYRVYIQR